MRINKPFFSLFGVLAASLAFAGCDDKKDVMTGNRDSNADEGNDDESDNNDDSGASDADTGGGSMTAGTAGTGGEVVIPPECQSLCDCIGMLGGDPNSCGMACGGAIVDDDPDDRTQCLTYLSMAMYTDCNAECESFGSGG